MTSDFGDVAERVNLERDLVTALTGSCRNVVAGYTVKRDMPGLKGPEVEALYARGAAWLQGKPLS